MVLITMLTQLSSYNKGSRYGLLYSGHKVQWQGHFKFGRMLGGNGGQSSKVGSREIFSVCRCYANAWHSYISPHTPISVKKKMYMGLYILIIAILMSLIY